MLRFTVSVSVFVLFYMCICISRFVSVLRFDERMGQISQGANWLGQFWFTD